MKRKLLLFLSLMACLAVGAQKNASEKFFDNIKDRDDVAIMSFSKSIIDMLDMNIFVQSDDNESVTGDLKEIKVTIFDKVKNPKNESETISFFTKSPFNEVDLEESDNNVRIFVNRTGKIVKECHVGFQGEKKFVLISFFGEFNVNDLKSLKESANSLKLNY